MNIADVITLAKQGYKPGDIKELIELAETKTQDQEPENTSNEDNQAVAANTDDKTGELEKRLADLEAQNKELMEKLQTAQSANRQQNQKPENQKSDADVIADLCRAFM